MADILEEKTSSMGLAPKSASDKEGTKERLNPTALDARKDSSEQKTSPTLTESGIKMLFELFSTDVSQVAPISLVSAPITTEHTKGTQNPGRARTPITYLSNLRLWKMQLPAAVGPPAVAEVNSHMIWTSTKLVIIDTVGERSYPLPTLSPFGMQMATTLNSDLSITLSTRALLPATKIVDQNSIITLLNLAEKRPPGFYDEAPLLRLLLLWHTMAPGSTYTALHDKCVTDVAANMRAGPWTSRWCESIANAGTRNITPGNAAQTSRIMACTLTMYTEYVSGISLPPAEMRNPDVVIPVMREWSGCRWLMAYILSFTTTGWWNHAMTVRTRPHYITTGLPEANWVFDFMPEACLTVLEGGFQRIWLVMVNASSANNAVNTPFRIQVDNVVNDLLPGIVNQNFATLAYTYLGRDVALREVPDRGVDFVEAWRRLLMTVTVPGVATKAISAAAELCQMRPVGYLRKTTENPTAAEHHGILLNTYTFALPALQRWTVLDEVVRDWGVLDAAWETIRPHLAMKANWRVTPLHKIPSSANFVGYGDDHQQDIPTMADWKDCNPEYQVCESYQVNRVLIACDVFIHSEEIRKYMFTNTPGMAIFTRELGTLLAATTEWIMCYYGLGIMDINGFLPTSTTAPDTIGTFFPVATNNFIINRWREGNYRWRDVDLLGNLRTVYQLDTLTFNHFNGLVLPFWLVKAICEKYGLRFKLPSLQEDVYLGDIEDGTNSGYPIDMTSPWAALPLLCGTDRYERHPFLIYKNSHGTYNTNSWALMYDDLYFEATTRAQGAAAGVTCSPVDTDRLVGNMQTIPFLHDNSKRDKRGAITFVGVETPFRDNTDRGFLSIEGDGIRHPDPLLSHLMRAGVAALPDILTLNYPGAVKSALISLADPALDWAVGKIGDTFNEAFFRSGAAPADA